jgi:hypothetical protein
MSSRLVIIGTLLLAVALVLRASPDESSEEPGGCLYYDWRGEVLPILRSSLTPAEKAARLAKYVRLGDDILEVEARFGHPNPTLTKQFVKTRATVVAYYAKLGVTCEEGKVVAIFVCGPGDTEEILAQDKTWP